MNVQRPASAGLFLWVKPIKSDPPRNNLAYPSVILRERNAFLPDIVSV